MWNLQSTLRYTMPLLFIPSRPLGWLQGKVFPHKIKLFVCFPSYDRQPCEFANKLLSFITGASNTAFKGTFHLHILSHVANSN